MEIQIEGYACAKKLLQVVEFDYVVSLMGDTIPPLHDEDRHLTLVFDDVHSGSDESLYTLPNEIHVRQLLEFSSKFTPEDKVLFHCAAGVSRSTASAILVLVQHGMSPVDAMQHVYDVRPPCWPNPLLIELGDNVLGQNGDIVDAVTAFKKNANPHHVTMPKMNVQKKDVDSMRKLMDLLNKE